MARLSHSPSSANLLAQYTALKGTPGAEQQLRAASLPLQPRGWPHAHLAAPRHCWTRGCARCGGASWRAGRPEWCVRCQRRSPRTLLSWPAPSTSPGGPSNPPLRCTLWGTVLVSRCHITPALFAYRDVGTQPQSSPCPSTPIPRAAVPSRPIPILASPLPAVSWGRCHTQHVRVLPLHAAHSRSQRVRVGDVQLQQLQRVGAAAPQTLQQLLTLGQVTHSGKHCGESAAVLCPTVLGPAPTASSLYL